MLLTMAERPVVFACANPDPEIRYELARETRRDVIIGTGRSDYPNQINNLLGFPFIFRGALDVRARAINERMKLAGRAVPGGACPRGSSRSACWRRTARPVPGLR